MRSASRRFVIGVFLLHQAIFAQAVVKPGESIQNAIDAAKDGDVIVLEAGVYPERIAIGKSITIQGAGWDKTILRPGRSDSRSPEEKIRFVDALDAAKSDNDRLRLMMAWTSGLGEPTIQVKSAQNVSLRGLKVQGDAPTSVEGLSNIALVQFADATAIVSECAIVGPFMNGISVTNGSDVDIQSTLVAAIWNTGVAVYPGDREPNQPRALKPAKVRLADCDIRNCYHRCVTISGEGSSVERCRISGSAWHGIRYDHSSPTITGNLIFGHARSGIYASGNTAATVRGNVFWKNEMDGISCWFNNHDTIEANTFADNLREAIAVCGDARPTISKNIVSGSPIAIACTQINDKSGPAGNPDPIIEGNVFWKNTTPLKRLQNDEPIPEGNRDADPKFADAAKQDFTVSGDIAAGASQPITTPSPWPMQEEEKAIVPQEETRDSRSWKKPKGDR